MQKHILRQIQIQIFREIQIHIQREIQADQPSENSVALNQLTPETVLFLARKVHKVWKT